ncbi:hypothetical protein NQ314_006478 [Rhamnusium bicolor]|uniref:CHK kinase-like domain-containing protein n=1 Tax=Rhamnusium bicolor TaxID=1586634 RepID=A0AAV8Z3U6_9CUCU|nr:hypothetical protein NQ314_006478 [Rhamnusium bicolor]
MSNILPPTVYDLINKVVNRDIKNFLISVHGPNKKGEGFMGQMCFVTLQEKNSEKILNFVVKQAIDNDFLRAAYPIRDIFMNEIYFYTKIWPCMQELQKVLPPTSGFNKIAKCFTTTSDNRLEKIVLENIKFLNFELFDKRATFDKEHVEFILKEYGKFHALSFACRASNPEEYFKLAKELKDIHLHLQPGKDDEIMQKYNRCIEDGIENFFYNNRYEGDYSVILHGDCWSNNMMFKYDILDELDYYLKVYHISLEEILKDFGLNSDDIYPFRVLKDDWKQYCHLGFIMGLFVWKIKTTYDEDVIDFSDFKENFEDLNEKYMSAKYDEVAFKKRTRELILHMCENNFL